MKPTRTKRAYTRRPQPEGETIMSEAAPDTMRPEPRAPMREDNPRARAKARAAQLMESVDFEDTAHDEFAAPPAPDGWTYEYKRDSVLGAKDPSYEVELAKMGWEAVPIERHPELMPIGFAGKRIEKKGMVLMERPKEITDMVRRRDQREATSRVQTIQDNLRGVKPGQFDRQQSNGESLVKVRTSIEPPMAIPE